MHRKFIQTNLSNLQTAQPSVCPLTSELIANDILSGTLPEESQMPYTNQFALFYGINPATAAKGMNLLVEQEILYKKRGIGCLPRRVHARN